MGESSRVGQEQETMRTSLLARSDVGSYLASSSGDEVPSFSELVLYFWGRA